MRLAPGAEVSPHADLGYYRHERMRIHVPILTQPAVPFHCGWAQVLMGAGEGLVFDNWRLHRVVNATAKTREVPLLLATDAGNNIPNCVTGWRPAITVFAAKQQQSMGSDSLLSHKRPIKKA